MAIEKNGEKDNALGLSGALLTPEEQKKKEEEKVVMPSATSTPSVPATSGSQATAPSPAVKPLPVAQKAGTGTFANLKSYLDANKGSRVASAAAQRIQKAATGAQKSLGQTQQQFQQQMQSGSLANQEKALEDVQSAINAARNVTYQAPQAAETQTTTEPAPTTPQEYLTPEQKQRFAEVVSAQYKGPFALQEISAYQDLQKRAAEAEQLSKQAQSPTSRADLLRSVFGRGREYTTGQSKLDELLLGQTEEGAKAIQQRATEAADVKRQLEAAGIQASTTASQQQKSIADIQQKARTAFSEGKTAEEAATEKRIDDLIKTPALDAQGKKIPKTDASGKVLKDAQGKIIYQTEWDRLPEYFKQVFSEKGRKDTAAKVKKEQQKAITDKYTKQITDFAALSNKDFSLKNQIAKLQKLIESPYTSPMNFFGTSDPNAERQARAKWEASVAAAKASLPGLQTQLKQNTEARNKLIASKEYKDYKKALSNISKISSSQLYLSPEEAATLGVGSGEGLYRLGPEAIKTAIAERNRLVTKDEVARQLALAELAGVDPSKLLSTQTLYSDLTKAGTQDLKSSLDVEAFKRAKEAEQAAFLKSAQETDITGRGKKKVSRGNAFGKKTRTYTAEQKGNVADMLESAGVDLSKLETDEVNSLLTNRELLNQYIDATRTSRGEGDVNRLGEMASSYAGASGGMSAAGSLGQAAGATGSTAAAGAATYAALPLAAIRAADLAQDALYATGLRGVADVMSDIRGETARPINELGDAFGSNVVGDVFRGVGGMVSGIDEGAMRSYGSSIAKQKAIEDLERQYEDYLNKWNVENRAKVVESEATKARASALQDLLLRRG